MAVLVLYCSLTKLLPTDASPMRTMTDSLRSAIAAAAALVLRRRGASMAEYAVLAGLIAVAVLGTIVLTGDRIKTLFDTSEERLTDGIAGLPLPDPTPLGGGMDGGPPPAG